MTSPKVSIGVPVFDAERFLPTALDSLLGQSFADTEVILCDNGSTDATPEICRQFQREDPRVRYHRNDRNLGVTANYNRAAELACGTYFKWASANDTCHPDYVAECVEILDSLPEVVLCHGRTRLVGDDGSERDYDGDFAAMEARPSERWIKVLECLRYNNVLNGVMRRRTLLQTMMLGPYISSDLTTIAELSLYGKIYLLPEVRFYRSMKLGAASARMTRPEAYAHFEPQSVGKLQFREWRELYEFGWGAARAPIPAWDKLVTARNLLPRALGHGRALWSELLCGLKWIATHSLGRQPEDGPC